MVVEAVEAVDVVDEVAVVVEVAEVAEVARGLRDLIPMTQPSIYLPTYGKSCPKKSRRFPEMPEQPKASLPERFLLLLLKKLRRVMTAPVMSLSLTLLLHLLLFP